jgi:hypothetical protein
LGADIDGPAQPKGPEAKVWRISIIYDKKQSNSIEDAG